MAYQPVTSAELAHCFGPRPGVQAFSDVVLWSLHDKGVRSDGIYNRRKVRGSLFTWSLHAVGRAVDIGVAKPSDPVGDILMMQCVAHADWLGICEVIWNAKRWTKEKGLRPYSGADLHRTHLHVGFTVDFADRPNTPELRAWIAHFLFNA